MTSARTLRISTVVGIAILAIAVGYGAAFRTDDSGVGKVAAERIAPLKDGMREHTFRPTQLVERADSYVAPPIRLAWHSTLDHPLSSEEQQSLLEKLRVAPVNANALPLSGHLHVAIVYGIEATLPTQEGGQSSERIIDILSDDRVGTKYFAAAPLYIRSRHGLHCRVALPRNQLIQPARQSHHGQLLREFARAGVPLTHSLYVGGVEYSLMALLDDHVANFFAGESEIEWTAIALSLYLPPASEWHNKFGDRFTFDDIADELLSAKSTVDRACQGIHLFEALAVLLQVDVRYGILSPATRNSVERRLAMTVETLVESQQRDGSWLPTSHVLVRGPRAESAQPFGVVPAHRAVQVTGHHLEWLCLLPPEYQPPPRTINAAAAFLKESVLAAEELAIAEHYCPYAHAASVLLRLSRDRATGSDIAHTTTLSRNLDHTGVFEP